MGEKAPAKADAQGKKKKLGSFTSDEIINRRGKSSPPETRYESAKIARCDGKNPAAPGSMTVEWVGE